VVRFGLIAEAIGIGYIALVVGPGVSFPELLPGYLFYGVGIGCAAAQLTNVVLEHVPSVKAGVVSGANATANQVGSALGVAVIGAILTARTISHASAAIADAAIPSTVKSEAVARVHSLGTNFAAPRNLSTRDVDLLHRILADAVGNGARFALLFAMGVVGLGAVISWLIPRQEPIPADAAAPAADEFDAFEPIEPGFAH
jgi:MFS family permease